METRMDEEQLDMAICEALGMHAPGESAAYQREVTASVAAGNMDRQLRETAARLAAASPHMKPPEALRGRILQATAPQTFKMEAYRKASREDYRFYKWGFYAAAVFLILGAMYNIDVGGKLKVANNNVASIQKQAQDLLKKQAQEFAMTSSQRDQALEAFVDPRGIPVTWKDSATGQAFGRGIVNRATHKALLIFPQELIPAGTKGQLTVNDNGTAVAYETTMITAPAVQLGMAVPANAPSIATMLKVQHLAPDETTSKPAFATFGGN